MRILIVNSGLSGGGAEQYLVQLSFELSKRGHKVFWIYGDAGDGKDRINGAKIFLIDQITNPNCENFDEKYKSVENILQSQNPDIIYFHQVYNAPLIDLLTAGYPSVRFVHDLKMICPDGAKTLNTTQRFCPYPLGYACQLHAYNYKCMPRNVFTGLPQLSNSKKIIRIHQRRSHVVVASKFMRTQLLANGFEYCKIVRIPYFTNLPKLDSGRDIMKKPLILALGRMVSQKGFDCLLRSFKQIQKKVKLVIVGDGPRLIHLKHYAESLGISHRVEFTGWLEHGKLDEYYRRCELIVVPSVWPEPFGIVGIEAMAYGKPVVAFDVGGISDWCRNQKNGFLVKPGDEIQLAQKIDLLLENVVLAHKMGAEGVIHVSKYFTPEIHLNSLLELFDRKLQVR